MGRITTIVMCILLLHSCVNNDAGYKANAERYGAAYNAFRKANNIDTLPLNWVLQVNEGGFNLDSALKWVNPDMQKLLADSTPFYGVKEIGLHADHVTETNWYYTGNMGETNYGEGPQKEPQIIQQKIDFTRSGEIIKITYWDMGMDNVPCLDYTDHYEELVRAFRDGQSVPLCPDPIIQPK